MTLLRDAASRLAAYGRMVKFSHTAFALPFALAAFTLAARRHGWDGETLLWVVAAMVGARSSAMMMNRLADRDVDARNPRTKERELPAGKVRVHEAWAFALAAAALFVFAAFMLHPLCFALSPVALGVLWGYSFMKRLSWASHVVLGLSLGIAPVGAWLAVAGEFGAPAFVLMAAVTTWVAGFDILYACQDVAFDRAAGLHAVPARFGVRAALRASAFLHVLTVLCLAALHVAEPALGWLHAAGVVVAGLLLLYEHALVRPKGSGAEADMANLPLAFFHVNAALGSVYFAFLFADVLLFGA